MIPANRAKIIISTVIFVLGISMGIPEQVKGQGWQKAKVPVQSEWFEKVNARNPLPEYPRPQMKRDRWKNLNGIWQYSFKQFETRPFDQSLNGEVLVPYPVESALSGVKQHSDTVWYRRTFDIPDSWTDSQQLVKLHFGAADWQSDVYVNGQKAGSHKGGYDRFTFDITSYLKEEGEQELLVRVVDPTNKGSQPRGKQVLDPGGIWYTPVTGIWQTVWLEPVNKAHITDLKIVPDPENDRFLFKVETANIPDDSEVFVVANVYEEGVEVNQVESGSGYFFEVPVPDPRLWSPENPYLYNVKVSLKINDVHVDSLESYAGMRSVEVRKGPDGNPRIMLNGEFVRQVGVLDQGYWPGGLYTAPTDEALKYDIQMAKKMGFNMIRKHVKVEPQRWYYWADKLGVLVWQDMPSAENETSASRKQFERELQQMVDEYYSHPSIVNWTIFNEGWGQFDTRRLADKVEKMDPSRLITDASGWQHRDAGDIIDIHRYPGPGAAKPAHGRASAMGEFGGVGYAVEGHTWQDKQGWGYQGLVKSKQKLLERYQTLMHRALWYMDRHHVSAAVYTQLTDLETELNGLMSYDRRVVKLDTAKLAAINQGKNVYIQPEDTKFTGKLDVRLSTADSDLVIRYTTDGSEPTLASSIYEKPFTIKDSTLVRARAFNRHGEPVGFTTQRTFKKTEGAAAVHPENVNNGLRYTYYEVASDNDRYMRHWKLRNALGKNSNVSPADSGNVVGIDIRTSNQTELFAYSFNGYIKIPETGNYTFYLAADDDARITISGKSINDRLGQSPTTSYEQAMIPLQEGFHTIKISYFQAYGPSTLQLEVAGPDRSRQPLPDDWLYHKSPH